MNGQLPLITVRPLKRPEFSYTRGVSFEDWVRANETELRAWYQLTSEWDPELHPADWHDFVAVQFDLSQELDARLTDALYETELRESDADDTPWDKTTGD